MSIAKRILARKQAGKSVKAFDAWFAWVRTWEPTIEQARDKNQPKPKEANRP